MAEATSDAFLSGQGIPVEPGQIESELLRLWGPAAERVGGPELEHPTVTRIVLANLVVEAGPGCPECLEATLDTVVARYPCRAIVLRRTAEPGRRVGAEVAALCHMPSADRPQVCSERIVLRAGPDAVDLLPGAVRPLLEANLPFVLWWTDDPRRSAPLFRDLAAECTRLVLDLPDPDFEPDALAFGLDPAVNPYIRDTAWFGITRWRELVAQFFDGAVGGENLARIDSLEVRAEVAAGSHGKVPRLAAWLAAWLAGQLGWTLVGRAEAGPGRLLATFRGAGGDVAVTLLAEEAAVAVDVPQILGVTLTTRSADGPGTYRLARLDARSPQVRVDLSSPDACAMPRIVLSPDLDSPGRITAALESSRVDPPFVRALPHLLRLVGVEGG